MVRLPWTVRRLPLWVPRTAAVVLLLSAILKPFKPNYMCMDPDPWEGINTGMFFLEPLMAWLLWQRGRRREWGALLGCGSMLGAAFLLTGARLAGNDVRACGCFGPIEMPYAAHMVFVGVLFVLCSVTLVHEHGSGLGTPGLEPGSKGL